MWFVFLLSLGVSFASIVFVLRNVGLWCLMVMRLSGLLLSALLLNSVAPLKAHAMAGELKSPSLAMPAEMSEALRTNILAIIGDSECKFLDGNFINASTTLRYGGSTESLNSLIARLSELDGVRITLSFIREPGGPAWTLKHNGWADPGDFFIQINPAASTIKLERLYIGISGGSKTR